MRIRLSFLFIFLGLSFLVSVGNALSRPDVTAKVIVGAVVNAVAPQGLIVESEGALDVAIAGNGFLPLRDVSGKTVFTRLGSLRMDRDGDLIQIPSGLKVLAEVDGGKLQPISLSAHAIRPSKKSSDGQAKIVSMHFEDYGELRAFYSDGVETTIATLSLAVFENSSELRIENEEHFTLVVPASASEVAFVKPGRAPAGSVFSHQLETISMRSYRRK